MENMCLEEYCYNDLKKLAQNMEIPIRRSKISLIKEIKSAFNEYERYKKNKLDKYKRLKQLGECGKERKTYLVNNRAGKEYVMKTFRKQKSSNKLLKEAELQKLSADIGVAPNIIDIDTVSKYIVMEKMDRHFLEVIKEQGKTITKQQQRQIISIYKKLDKVKVFHGDVNLMNYMYKGDKLFIIDFGMAKEVTSVLIKNLDTDTPNMNIMTLRLALKLRELGFSKSSYEYIVKYLSDEQCIKFGFKSISNNITKPQNRRSDN